MPIAPARRSTRSTGSSPRTGGCSGSATTPWWWPATTTATRSGRKASCSTSPDRSRPRLGLQEAENRYRTIVERVPAVAYVWDAGNEPGTAPAAYISPQIQRLLGYTPEEWFDDPNLWADRLHPEDVDGVFSRWDAAVAAAGAFTAEYRIRSKSGELLWLRDEAIPVADGASGRPVYQGVMYDITEQRGTNERLREAEERYRTLVENLPVVTYTAAADETGERDLLRYVAPGIERLTGYTPEAWTADAGFWESLIHPEDRDRVVASSRACEDTGDPFDEEYRLIRADGAVIWVHDSAVVVEHEDEAAVWQGVFEDISARKAAERAVVQAEGRYRNLVEHLPAVVYIDEIDELATAHYVSPQYERLTGYSPAHRLATPDLWVKMLHPEDRERVLAESDRTNESGEPFDIEYRIVRADGEVRWLHDHAFQVEGLDGGMALAGGADRRHRSQGRPGHPAPPRRDLGGGRLRRRAVPAGAGVARRHRRRPRPPR